MVFFIGLSAWRATAVRAANFTIQLDAYGSDGIRVRIAPGGSAIVEPPLSALLPTSSPAARTTSASSSELVNGNMHVAYDPATGFVTATRVSDGALLLRQTGLQFAASTMPKVRAGSMAAAATFALQAGERLYGFGQHRINPAAGGDATLNMVPYAQSFADSQDYGVSRGRDVSIPMYTSSTGLLFVWNSPSLGAVNVTTAEGGSVRWDSVATLNVDFLLATTPADAQPAASPFSYLLQRYADAVGHAPALPSFMTGFVQSKNRYRTQEQLLSVARGYANRSLPVSVIVLDYFHWLPGQEGSWAFNPACFPDPQAMVDELRSLGIELMVTFWPFVNRTADRFANFSARGFLAPQVDGSLQPYDGFQNGILVDQTQAEARQAVFEEGWWEGYGRFGIRAVWLDAAEPERQDGKHVGNVSLSVGTDAEVGAGWVAQHLRSFAEGFASRGVGPSEFFLLPRSQWAGGARFSAGLWSGDIDSTFDELARQVVTLQTAAMSGIVHWGSDTGGYLDANTTDPTFQELLVRWLQFSAFTPLMRLHGRRLGGPAPDPVCGATYGPNELWTLAPDQAHYGAMAGAVLLREDLRGYVGALSAEAAASGMPLARPMFLAWPSDPGCQGPDVEGQYMFGPAWLVRPVVERGAANASVYLPSLPPGSGQRWTYWWTQADFGTGGSRVVVPTPLDEFPLFFLEGAPPPGPPARAPGGSDASAESDAPLSMRPRFRPRGELPLLVRAGARDEV